jgi:nicotinamidase-related amidase
MPAGRTPLCRCDDSLLLVVDIQERLARAMPEDARQRVIRNTGILLQAANRLGVPRFLTEQYTKGLGPTEAEVLRHLGENTLRVEKMSFSGCAAEGLVAALKETGRRQAVIAGMEAHVCVLQTAVELHALGFEVFVVEDATSSRSPANHQNAMQRLRQAGVIVANTESVVFEWLRVSTHEHFKAISTLLR